uniref:PDZ domain-containing protein n=1 Tax=Syphacia muris TaxID=451379 RepID=A0A0N5AK63_9BILA
MTTATYCQQSKRPYVTPPHCNVRVHRFQCMRDSGILDPDDRLFDVFDENNDQILAIYDEQEEYGDRSTRFAVSGTSPSTSSPVTFTGIDNHKEKGNNAFSSSTDGDIVEITSLAEPPSNGLRVFVDGSPQQPESPSASTAFSTSSNIARQHYEERPVPFSNSSTRLYTTLVKTPGSPRLKHRTDASSELERKYIKNNSTTVGARMTPLGDVSSAICRSSARKSRIADSFFEAKERLEEVLSLQADQLPMPSSSKEVEIFPLSGKNHEQTVITLSESSVKRTLGIEISPIYDPSNDSRLQSVEVRQINEEGRVAADGRIKVGDHIVEINSRPVYQMSISRARGYLRDLQMVPSPTLTIDRPISTFKDAGKEPDSQPLSTQQMKRPILSALQQANTTAVGTTTHVEIKKDSHGFGFNITGRETAKGERLFYVGTVKPGGPAFGILRTGDRLLEVNGEPTKGLKQNNVVDKLKALPVGDKVALLISRIEKENGGIINEDSAAKANDSRVSESKSSVSNTQNFCSSRSDNNEEILSLDIPLNGSAGLGISLKALSRKKNGCTQDCGIFIKRVLHGGAAFKDGQLRVNDQLIGIEDIDLRALKKNSEASEAVTKHLKTIGPSTRSVRLLVARNIRVRPHDHKQPDTLDSNKNETDSDAGICRLHVDGYGDYATIVKSRVDDDKLSSTSQRRRANSIDGSNSNNWSDKASLTGGEQHCTSEDELSHVDVDTFSRENPTRRSMSEKRHMGSSNDPSHTAVFQRIKHFRQASAPALRETFACSSTGDKVDTASPIRSVTSLQNRRLCCSDEDTNQKIFPIETLTPVFCVSVDNELMHERKVVEHSPRSSKPLDEQDPDVLPRASVLKTSPKRRSLSVENIGSRESRWNSQQQTNSPVLKKTVNNVLRRSNRIDLLERKRSVEETADFVNEDSCVSRKVDDAGETSFHCMSTDLKDRQLQHKPAGSSFLSRIGQKLGGSWSRDSSPEKNSTFDPVNTLNYLQSKEEEERRRIQDQYDRLKQKQQQRGAMFFMPSTAYYNNSEKSHSFGTFESNRMVQVKKNPTFGDSPLSMYERPRSDEREGRGTAFIPFSCYNNGVLDQFNQGQYNNNHPLRHKGFSADYCEAFNAWFVRGATAANETSNLTCGGDCINLQSRYTSPTAYYQNVVPGRAVHHERFHSCPGKTGSSHMKRDTDGILSGSVAPSRHISEF